MAKIGAAFRNFRDRIRASINVKARNILFFFALALIIFLAIMIRMTPILRGPTLIKAFDPWIQYYNANYLSDHTLYEYYHWWDYKSWYPGGKGRWGLRPGLPFTVVVIYKILNFVGIPITIYEVCFYFPAFMGGMTCLAAYLLGKEAMDRRCGLLAAFFLAFNTGHMQRTMAGFFDNETIGVFATLMTFFFFLKALHTGKTSHAICGGIFLGYLTLSWGGFEFVYFIIPCVCIILILLNKYDENVLIAYAGVMGTAFIINSIYVNFVYAELFSSLSLGGVFLFIPVLTIFHLLYMNRNEYPKLYIGLINGLKWGLIPILLVSAIVIWINPALIPFGIGGRLASVLSPLMRDQMHIIASVAEHMPSAWSIFYYNTLIPLMLLPLGIFFCFKRGSAADVLMILFLLTIFYFTGSMIRIILLFAPAAALMGAYGLVNVLKIFGSFVGERKIGISRKRRRQLKRTIGNAEVSAVYILVGFLCMAQIFHATDISINQLSYSQMVAGGQFHDWEESLTWMKNNLEGTDVVVSWWDYGYWLTPVGNVTTVNDNATRDQKRIGLTGMALMQTDEIYSAKILRELHADYVLVYFGFLISGLGGDEGKWPWMLRICNDNYEYYKDQGFEEDNWASDSVFVESEYINGSSGLYEDKWFDSQLVRLMFGYEPTDPNSVSDPNANYLRWNYASNIAGNPGAGIGQREDDNGNPWKDHIPDNGLYGFKVFKPKYFSKNGLVKLYQVDYTALDSSFEVKDAEVFDNGYGTFTLQNLGNKELDITDVKINDESFDFEMSKSYTDKKLAVNSQDTVWININESITDFKQNDVVNITVTASAEALQGQPYPFTNYTSNFFVTKGKKGEIRINRENSRVTQNTQTEVSIELEIENTGLTTVNLDEYWIGFERVPEDPYISYTDGSKILAPGQTASVLISNKSADFYPLGHSNTSIFVITKTNDTDETIFSSNLKNYKLSIINENRVGPPELVAITDFNLRSNIPVEMTNSYFYCYGNGTNIAHIRVKNTGDVLIGLDAAYLGPDLDPVPFDTIDQDRTLDPGEETIILADATDVIDCEINDNNLFTITAINYNLETAASDIGYIFSISNESHIKFIEGSENYTVSFVQANETATIMVKNTGNEPLTLDKVYINDTIVRDCANPDEVSFDFGDATLDLQEVSVIRFDTPGLEINKSDPIKINVTTNTTAQYDKVFDAIVNRPQGPIHYEIGIDETNTSATVGGQLKIDVAVPDKVGYKDLNVSAIFVNDTSVPLFKFKFYGTMNYSVEKGEHSYFLIDLSEVSTIIAKPIVATNTLKIVVRTKEGAEDEYTLIVA